MINEQNSNTDKKRGKKLDKLYNELKGIKFTGEDIIPDINVQPIVIQSIDKDRCKKEIKEIYKRYERTKIVDLRGLELIPVDVLNISINGDDGSDGNEVEPPPEVISMVGGISTDLADDDVKVSDQDDLEPHTTMLERQNKY